MRKGFSLVEILVALAVFGLVSGVVLSSLLGLFRINRSASLEGQAAVVAKDLMERAVRESTYSANTLRVPLPSQTQGFSVALEAAGRMAPSGSLSFGTCSRDNTGFSCTVACNQGNSTPCRLVALKLTLTGSGKSYAFYREWAP